MLRNAIDLLFEKLTHWFNEFILFLPNLVVALLVLVVIFLLARYIRRVSRRIIRRITMNQPITNFIAGVIHYFFLLIGFILALSILQLDKAVTSILAGAGVVGLALGLAFQNPIKNTVSGFIMSYRKYYRIGDYIETNGYFGKIVDIGIRVSEMRLPTGEMLVLPNDIIVNNTFKNFSINGTRGVVIKIGVSYNDDLDKVELVIRDTIEQEIEHDINAGIEVYFTDYDSSSINFMVRYWINHVDDRYFQQNRSNAIKAIKKAFHINGITIPYPIYTLDFGGNNGEKLPGYLSKK